MVLTRRQRCASAAASPSCCIVLQSGQGTRRVEGTARGLGNTSVLLSVWWCAARLLWLVVQGPGPSPHTRVSRLPGTHTLRARLGEVTVDIQGRATYSRGWKVHPPTASNGVPTYRTPP